MAKYINAEKLLKGLDSEYDRACDMQNLSTDGWWYREGKITALIQFMLMIRTLTDDEKGEWIKEFDNG